MRPEDTFLSEESGSSGSNESLDEEIQHKLSMASVQEKRRGFWPLLCSALSLLGLLALLSVVLFIQVLHYHRPRDDATGRSRFWCSADFSSLRSEMLQRPLPSIAFKAMHACAEGQERSAECDLAQASVTQYTKEHDWCQELRSQCGLDTHPCLWELFTAGYGEEAQEEEGRRVKDVICIPTSCDGDLTKLEWELAKEEFCKKVNAESCMVHVRCPNVTRHWA